MKEKSLEDRFNETIGNREFDFFEWQGFKTEPRLALLAGMAIGYQLACEDTEKILSTKDREEAT